MYKMNVRRIKWLQNSLFVLTFDRACKSWTASQPPPSLAGLRMTLCLQGADEQLHCERCAHVRGFAPVARCDGRQHTEEY